MYLYFKFINKCPNYPENPVTVALNLVQPAFKNTKNGKTKKYYVQCGCQRNCAGSVGFVGETIDDIQKQVRTSRAKFPPYSILQTASEYSSDDNENTSVSKTNDNNGNKHQVLSEKLKILSHKKKLKEDETKQTKKNETPKQMKKTEASKDTKTNEIPKQTKKNETPKQMKKTEASKHTKTNEIPKQTKKNETPKQMKKTEASKDTKTNEIPKQTKKNETLKQAKEIKTPKQPTENKTAKQVEGNETPKQTRKTEIENPKQTKEHETPKQPKEHETAKQPKENETAKDKLSSAPNIMSASTLPAQGTKEKNENRSQEEIIDLKRKLIDITLENKRLRSINSRMEDKVVNYFEEVRSSIHSISSSSAHLLEKKITSGEELPVGTINEAQKQIHIGFGKWIDVAAYDCVRYQTNINPQKFIKGMASVIFTDETLKMSTCKGKKQSHANGKPGLPSTDLEALKAISSYWMTDVKKIDPHQIHLELSKIPTYINHKISDLNRPPRKRPHKIDDAGEDENMNKIHPKVTKKTKVSLNEKEKVLEIESNTDEDLDDERENIENDQEESGNLDKVLEIESDTDEELDIEIDKEESVNLEKGVIESDEESDDEKENIEIDKEESVNLEKGVIESDEESDDERENIEIDKEESVNLEKGVIESDEESDDERENIEIDKKETVNLEKEVKESDDEREISQTHENNESGKEIADVANSIDKGVVNDEK